MVEFLDDGGGVGVPPQDEGPLRGLLVGLRGADAIRRFARPLCFQNFLDSLLPAELQRSNPLGIWRTLNNELTRGEG